jgi:hypothetical protein
VPQFAYGDPVGVQAGPCAGLLHLGFEAPPARQGHALGRRFASCPRSPAADLDEPFATGEAFFIPPIPADAEDHRGSGESVQSSDLRL